MNFCVGFENYLIEYIYIIILNIVIIMILMIAKSTQNFLDFPACPVNYLLKELKYHQVMTQNYQNFEHTQMKLFTF